MSGRFAMMPPPRVPGLTFGMVFEAWRDITPIQLRTTFLLGCALLAYHVAFGQAPPGVVGTLIMLILDQIRAFSLLLAVVTADRATARNVDRRGAYALAVVAGSLTAALVAVPTAGFLLSTLMDFYPSVPRRSALGGNVLYYWLETIVLGGATVWVRNSRQRAEFARARMQAAELERIAAAKQTVESELQAMQARVEPQFLFNTLARVKQLYRLDPAQAEPMLDEFISYLRAAMPRMRDTSSTIRQEIELVRAYLGIVRFQVDLHLEFEFETPDGLAEARMPAMMLLPLVEQAIAHRFSRRQAAGALCIRLVRADDRIRVEISDSGDSDSSGNEGQSIAGIRERLVTLFGTAASLILQRGDGGSSKAILEIPLEAAPECSHASGDAPALAAT